jgi:hypothetical protein
MSIVKLSTVPVVTVVVRRGTTGLVSDIRVTIGGVSVAFRNNVFGEYSQKLAEREWKVNKKLFTITEMGKSLLPMSK